MKETNPIIWNLERAIEHLRGAYQASRDDKNPTRHADLREILESVNLTLGAAVQHLEEQEAYGVLEKQPMKRPNTAAFFDNEGELLDDD